MFGSSRVQGCKSRPKLKEVKGSEAQGQRREVRFETKRGAKMRADVQEPDLAGFSNLNIRVED